MTIESTPKAGFLYIIMYIVCFVLISTSNLHSQSSITGKVWLDINYDGNISAGEQGLANIPVFLTTCSGQFVNAMYSDGNGNYLFSNLPANSYKVFFNISSLGPLYKFTLLGPQTDNKTLANGFTLCSVTATGVLTLHGGLTASVNIGDKIWEDLDYDGVQDQGEPGIPNVMAQLINAADGTVRGQTQSSQDGSYQFFNADPGMYYLSFGLDATYKATVSQSNDLTNSDVTGDNGPNTTGTFLAGAGQNITTIDAGYYQCASLCGTVFFDQNQNDTLDIFENGINGITIELWKVTETDTSIFAITQTSHKAGTPSDDGYYTFCVTPGFYYIKIIIPQSANLVADIPFQAQLDGHDSYVTHDNGPNTTTTIWVGSGDTKCNINGGYFCGSTITTRAWLDENENGIREPNETALSGVEVSLFDANHHLIESGITHNDGICRFDSLKTGNYFVYCSGGIPGLTFTVAHAGNEQLDSDIDNTFGPGSTNQIGVSECSQMDETGIGFKPGIILPLVWGAVDAYWNGSGQAVVRWSVYSEADIEHYRVFSSADNGKSWLLQSTLKAENKQSGASYSLGFVTAERDILVRVAAVGFDGSELRSPIAKLQKAGQSGWEIYPNPAQNYLDITSDATDPAPCKVEILNSSGMVVYQEMVTSDKTCRMDISGFSPGLYAAVFSENGRVVKVVKVVINH